MFLFLSKLQQLYVAFFGMVESVADLDLWRRWHSQPTWELHLHMCVQTNHIMACVVRTYIHNEIHQLHTKYQLPITSGNVNSLFWSTMAFTVRDSKLISEAELDKGTNNFFISTLPDFFTAVTKFISMVEHFFFLLIFGFVDFILLENRINTNY